jgi:CheY-like chemotaxis protein
MKPIEILLIEDNPGDVRLVREMLAENGTAMFSLEVAEQLQEGLVRLAQGGIDLVLLDLRLPDSCGLDTFIKTHARIPGVPIVVLTALDDETIAVKAVQGGAQDYLIKGRVNSYLLTQALRYALERGKLIRELQDALDKIKTLRGLLPICSYCKKIRNDKGYWERVEDYIEKHTDVQFSHGICKECLKKISPETYRRKYPAAPGED